VLLKVRYQLHLPFVRPGAAGFSLLKDWLPKRVLIELDCVGGRNESAETSQPFPPDLTPRALSLQSYLPKVKRAHRIALFEICRTIQDPHHHESLSHVWASALPAPRAVEDWEMSRCSLPDEIYDPVGSLTRGLLPDEISFHERPRGLFFLLTRLNLPPPLKSRVDCELAPL